MHIPWKHLLKPQAKPRNKTKAPQRDTLHYIVQLFRRFLTGQQHLFGLALLMLIAEAVTSIFEAYPLAYMIDYLKGDRVDLLTYLGWPGLLPPLITTVALLTLGILGMAMINSFGDSLAEIYLAQVGRTLGYNLRAALYKHLQRLSLAFHDQRRTGDILTRITGDVSEVEDFIIGSLSDIIGSLLVLAGTLVYLFYQSWQIGLVATLIIPLMAVVSHHFARQIKVATKQQRAREGDLATATQEMLSSIRVIQTYSQGDHELKRFADVNERNAAIALQTAKLQARFSWVMKVLESLAISGVVWLGLWLIHGVQPPAITVGTLVLFIDQIRNMFKPTRKIIKEWNTIGKIYASVERIGELLDRQPAVSNLPNAVPAPTFRGQIQLQAVSFAYQASSLEGEEEKDAAAARQVLDGITFTANPGEVLALVGQTGAGKSTIIQLLPRLYDPSAGQILIDGTDIRTFTLESLRSQISVVLQETVLFTGTVAENIAYGRTAPGSAPTQEEIIEAAIQANAHSFIEKLPQGYETVLGERGANLSGGQRQRLAIARAFIRNAPILILDEPTTGLDPESSELVLLALRLLMRGKTTIIISHDYKLVRQADKIVVLAAGRIEQMGTHRELIESGGTYANLYIKQFGHLQAHAEQPDNGLYDLLHSPAFQYKWPAIQTAFDAVAMQTHLQQAFFGATDWAAGANRYTIVQCKPGKASYLDGEGCLLRYEIQLQQAASDETTSTLLLAHIFADLAEAEAYLHGRLAPLATKVKGRPELAPFADSPRGPLALIEELNMVVSVFPLDGELPALVGATNQQQMAQFFDETLPEAHGQRFVVDDCTIDAGHYGRQHRCVLRYTVDGRWVDANQQTVRQERQVIYGKVAADDRCKVVGMVLNALHWQMAPVKSSRRFVLPRIVGYQPKSRLILVEEIPGTPLIPQLMQAQLTGKAAVSALTLSQAIYDCAQVAVALHKTAINPDKPRTFADELAYIESYLPATQAFSLALAMQLQHGLRRLQRYAEQTQPLPLALSHGDFTYTQLLFAEESCGLVDFDTVCQAEPALDLGQFLAYLRLAAHKAHKQSATVAPLAVDELCEYFINSYLRAAGYAAPLAQQLRERVAVYEIISLMRIALHSWQKLKGNRLELVLELLEERIECLPQVIAKPDLQLHQAPKVRKSANAKPFRLAKPVIASPHG